MIAKLEAGKTRNIGLQTLVRAVKAMNGSIEVSITPKGHRGRRRAVVKKARKRQVAARQTKRLNR